MPPWNDAALRATLAGRLDPDRILLRMTVGSTNDEVRCLAAAGAPSGTAVAAAEQTAGRGRLGRGWHSPDGEGLYVSVLWRSRRPPDELPRWSLAAAAAAYEACRDTSDANVRIKWPNDLMCGARKVGGILAESWGPPTGLAVVVGVGVNVSQARASFPGSLRDTATSLGLEASGGAPSRESLLAAFLLRFDEMAGRLENGDWATVRVRWERGAGAVVGRRVGWTVEGGGTAVGVVEALTERGTLALRAEDGARREAVLGESLRWLE